MSGDGKTLLLESFFNEKNDLYRAYSDEHEPILSRGEINKNNVIRMTDQVMLGYEQAVRKAGNNPATAELHSIVHSRIVTPHTEQVIYKVLEESGRDKELREDKNKVVSFKSSDMEFDALMGTIHGTRTAQMLME